MSENRESVTKAQSEMISLTEELLGTVDAAADKIYIYAYESESESFVNGFFEKDGKIVSFDDLFEYKTICEHLSTCCDIIDDAAEECEGFPCEMKLIYDTDTKALDAEYKYDTLDDSGKDLVEIFDEWTEECRNSLS